MRIRRFACTISKHLQKYNLNNKTVVIDGYNYFHDLYTSFDIPSLWGPESNTYAKYLRAHLQKFKRADVKCYFIIMGGCIIEEKLGSRCCQHKVDESCYIEPKFMKNIYKQVLDELGFDYVVCKMDYKKECIALAQKLSCPIISFDIEYCFSGVDYIPHKRADRTDPIVYNERTHILSCEIFRLNDFLKTCRISKELLSIFIILRDEKKFKIDIYERFFKNNEMSLMYSRNELLLSWLSNKTATGAIKQIFSHISPENQSNFLKAKESVLSVMEDKMETGIPSLYFTNRNKLKINEMDPLWFEKGLALKHIPIPYIDVYIFKVIVPSFDSNPKYCHPDDNNVSQNSLIICLDIIKYAFDLLTNFSGDVICFKFKTCCKRGNKDIVIDYSISKPNYIAQNCVFENGWQNIKQLKLFHHFISHTLPRFDFRFLDRAPESAQLLIIALVYFSYKKSSIIDTYDEVSSIMLSYVTFKFISLPIGKTTLIPEKECTFAKSVLNKYFFGIKNSDLEKGPCFCLYEFQECLEQLNYLNILCGKPFVLTIYSDIYNATFVHNMLMAKKSGHCIKKMLSTAPTIIELYCDLMEIYEKTLNTVSGPAK